MRDFIVFRNSRISVFFLIGGREEEKKNNVFYFKLASEHKKWEREGAICLHRAKLYNAMTSLKSSPANIMRKMTKQKKHDRDELISGRRRRR